MIRADNNRFGITGLAPEASFCGVSIFGAGGSPARAIKTAADRTLPLIRDRHGLGPDEEAETITTVGEAATVVMEKLAG